MGSGIKMDIKFEQRALLGKITRMTNATGKARVVVIREAMNLFAQSVVKATPPLTKAKDCATKNKRRIVPLTEEDSATFQAFASNPRNRVKNPHAFWDYIQHNWPVDHAWRMRFKVAINKSQKSFTRLFHSRSAAARYQPITYRNIGKQSWIAAMQIAGVPTTAKRPSGTAVMVGKALRLSSGKGPKESTVLILSAYVQSRVIGIGRYAIYAVAQALRKTNTRLGHALKTAGKRIAKA